MSTAEVTAWVDHICYLYGLSPSVTLTVPGSSGNRTAMSDTRMQAGSQSTSTTAFPSEGTTAEPSTVTVSYDRVSQTNASISPTSDTAKTWPVYQTTSGATTTIQAMTLADVKDTFIFPAINKLVSGTESATTSGTYTITTSSSAASNYTNTSTTPVFIDTRANTGAYSSGGIPETLDQPTTVTNYYLHIRTGADTAYSALKQPVYITAGSAGAATGNDLQTYTEATIEGLFTEWIRETASEDAAGYQLTYDLTTGGSGNTRGTGMADTKLNGSGLYTTRFVGLDDYRAQEFPNGSAATISTYYLRINKA
jgi:hypothetical protein